MIPQHLPAHVAPLATNARRTVFAKQGMTETTIGYGGEAARIKRGSQIHVRNTAGTLAQVWRLTAVNSQISFANSLTDDFAAGVNFKVMACSEDSYCCSYPDGFYPLDAPSFDCCDDPKRNFTAGPADFLAGYPVTTGVFVGFTSVSGSRAGTSTPKSSTSPSSTSTTESKTTTSSTSSTATSAKEAPSTTLVTSQTTGSSTSSTSITTSTSSTSSATDAAVPTEGINASATADPTASSSPTAGKESGIGSGVAAGIGVGAGVAVLALVGFGVFAGLRLRKRDSAARNDMSKESADGYSMGQWERQPAYSRFDHQDVKSPVGINEAGWQLPSEADSIPRGELEGDSFRR